MERSSETEQLERVDQTPVLSYVSDWSLADWWWNRDVTMESVQQFTRDTGTEVQVAGNAIMVQNLMADMARLLGLGILVIYIILAIRFESVKYPFIIILVVPFAWVGAITATWLAGTGRNAMAFRGVLVVRVVACNDSVRGVG